MVKLFQCASKYIPHQAPNTFSAHVAPYTYDNITDYVPYAVLYLLVTIL